MKSLELLRHRAENLVAKEPIWEPAFPPQPWDEADLTEIMYIVETFLFVDDVINEDPWLDWVDSWKFYQASK